MIELTPTSALMMYLLATISTLLILWGYQHFKSRTKKLDLIEKKLETCEYCHYAYLFEVGRPVSQCPQCGSFNKK